MQKLEKTRKTKIRKNTKIQNYKKQKKAEGLLRGPGPRPHKVWFRGLV